MKTTNRAFLLLWICSLLVGMGCRRSARVPDVPLSLSSLVGRMTNLVAFAERPLGQSYLVSSYDRRGGNQDWATWTQGDAEGRVTLLDVDGPGYVSRMWIASVEAKRWLFFFDGESTPRLVLTSKELFGGAFPFQPPLAGMSGGGRYSLVPIPFAKHIRVMVEPKEFKASQRNYFQINYTLLSAGAATHESWPQTLSVADSNAVAAVNSEFKAKDARLTAVRDNCLKDAVAEVVPTHQELVFHEARGTGCLDAFAIRVIEPTGGEVMRQEILRNVRLRMFWDGAAKPSVDVPIGDFFCNPLYTRRFSSFLLGNVEGTYVCRIPMPYRKGARCQIVNEGDHDVRLVVGAKASGELPDSASRPFHAKWAASSTSGRPFTMANCSGSGHFLGCFLTAIGQDGSWNILEGDEYLIPNGDRSLGQYGTGLEDYFSGAYYYTSLFDLPYHGLIEKGAMRTDQYRFHNLDAVDFEDGLECGIEFGDQNRAQGYLSSVVYWYADQLQDVSLSSADERLLARPADRFELPGFMSQMFSLERESLWADAAARCEFMAARYQQYPWAEIFSLRSVGYRERVEGFRAVKPEYERFAKSKFAPVAKQAQDHLWAAESDDHALLGLHVRGKYKVWIDGVEVAAGDSKARLDVKRLNLSPGPHSWEVDFTPTMQGGLFSLCLRAQWGDITSAGAWDIVDSEPHPGRDVPKKFNGGSVLPNMTVWQFEPNAFVGMQSPAQYVVAWSFWDSRPKVKRVRLRQTWTNSTSVVVAPLDVAPERTKEELRAHAID